MRKIRAWGLLFLTALCITLFSGCGGSLDNNSSETATTNQITSILTGTWVFDSSEGYNGYATDSESTSNRVVLRYSSGMKMVFSDFDFSGSTTGYEGSAKLFYTHSAAVFSNNVQVGTVNIKSYSSSTDTEKTKQMTIKRVDENEWILTPASGSSNIPTVTINVSTNSKINVQWTGSAYISALQGTYNYHISCSFIKTSSTPIYDEDDESTDDDSSIADTLKGTWLLHTEDTATATNINTGEALTLDMSTGNKISFFNFSDTTDTSTNTPISADVFYSQNWLALDGDEIATGQFTIKSYSDDDVSGDRIKEMTLVKISDNVYRLGGLTGNSETLNVTLTLVSNNEISTQWNGIVYNKNLKGYYNCDVTCSFRKSSTTPTSDDITAADDETLANILEKTWAVSTQNNQIETVSGDYTAQMLLISSDITFDNVDINGDSGTAVISLDQYWRVTILDGDAIVDVIYTSLNLHNKAVNMTRAGNNKWRCYFVTPSGDDEKTEFILSGSLLNIEVTSASSLHIIQDGIVITDDNVILMFNQNALDYWEK